MNRYTLKMLFLVMFVVGGLPFSVLAQGTNSTCDDVLTSAQTAYDAGDLETALELASQAVDLAQDERNISCANRARALKVKVEQAIEIDLAEPGMVNVGDYNLFMSCIGEGSPTVIFENGWSVSRETWNDVIGDIAQTTRACTYDRLGHGFSDPYPPDIIRTAQDQVEDLMGVLEVAEIEAPYVLVAHCGAGMNIRLFADQYPEQVAGLVMVDAFVPGLFFEQGANILVDIRAFAMDTERLDLDTSLQQVSTVGTLGDLPLVVLTAYLQPTPIPRDDWVALQAAYTTHSTNSRHIIAEHSGHYIMEYEPELIVEAIQWVLEQKEALEQTDSIE